MSDSRSIDSLKEDKSKNDEPKKHFEVTSMGVLKLLEDAKITKDDLVNKGLANAIKQALDAATAAGIIAVTLDFSNINEHADLSAHLASEKVLPDADIGTWIEKNLADHCMTIQEQVIEAVRDILIAENCKLSVIDLSGWKITGMHNIHIANHKENIIALLGDGISNNSSLTSLYLSSSNLQINDVKQLSKILKKKTYPLTVNLRDNEELNRHIKTIESFCAGKSFKFEYDTAPTPQNVVVKKPDAAVQKSETKKPEAINTSKAPAMPQVIISGSSNNSISSNITTEVNDPNAPTFWTWERASNILKYTAYGLGGGFAVGLIAGALGYSLIGAVTILGISLSATGIGLCIGIPLLVIGGVIGLKVAISIAEQDHKSELNSYMESGKKSIDTSATEDNKAELSIDQKINIVIDEDIDFVLPRKDPNQPDADNLSDVSDVSDVSDASNASDVSDVSSVRNVSDVVIPRIPRFGKLEHFPVTKSSMSFTNNLGGAASSPASDDEEVINMDLDTSKATL